MSQGAIPPDFVVDKSLAVVEAFVAAPPEENVVYTSFIERLDAAGVDGAADYAERALAIVSEQVIPAYRRIGDYLGEIRPSAPHEAGIWRLPQGEALYAAMIRHMTDTERSPDEVHQVGLEEVERITGGKYDAKKQLDGLRSQIATGRADELAAQDLDGFILIK